MGTKLGDDGSCVATTDGWSPKTYGDAEISAHQASTLFFKTAYPDLADSWFPSS